MVHDFAKQGKWISWDNVMELDLRWNNLLYALPPKLSSFALNAIGLTLPTPDNLRIWGKHSDGKCGLCASPACTLFHVLCHCPFSLANKRYNWRHDSVLRTLEPFVRERIAQENASKERKFNSGFITFVRAGEKPSSRPTKSNTVENILFNARDWQVTFDYDHIPSIFPTHICATDQRPDMVLWSESTRQIIIVELTIPAEEGMADAHNRKLSRYESLVATCFSQGWSPVLLPIEIGCKGFVGFSFIKCCKKLGFAKHSISHISKLLSKVALRCSYLIYLSRNNQNWKPFNLSISVNTTSSQFIDPDDAMFSLPL
jgi:hypothetical protein